MFFKLDPSWMGIHFQDKPIDIFRKFFFYSGIIQPDQDKGSERFIGHMFDKEHSRLFQLEFNWQKLHFSWIHRELNDFLYFDIYKKERGALWIGNYEIVGVGKGKVKCLISENISEMFRKKSC